MTDAVWAVAVRGPEALRSHCGAVGQLLREVVGSWEQGRLDVGNQEQLWQLWQVARCKRRWRGWWTGARGVAARGSCGGCMWRRQRGRATEVCGAQQDGQGTQGQQR